MLCFGIHGGMWSIFDQSTRIFQARTTHKIDWVNACAVEDGNGGTRYSPKPHLDGSVTPTWEVKGLDGGFGSSSCLKYWQWWMQRMLKLNNKHDIKISQILEKYGVKESIELRRICDWVHYIQVF